MRAVSSEHKSVIQSEFEHPSYCIHLVSVFRNVAVYVDAYNKLLTEMMSCSPGQIMQSQGMCWC